MWKWTCMLELCIYDQNKKIGVYGIMWLHTLPQLKSLTYINLRGNEIGDEGLRMFTMYDWKILQHLNLSNNEISCRGLVNMMLANWPQLNKMDLSKSNFTHVKIKLGNKDSE